MKLVNSHSCQEDQTVTRSWNSKSFKCQEFLWGTAPAAEHPPVSQAIVLALTRMLECLPCFTICRVFNLLVGILVQQPPSQLLQLSLVKSRETAAVLGS